MKKLISVTALTMSILAASSISKASSDGWIFAAEVLGAVLGGVLSGVQKTHEQPAESPKPTQTSPTPAPAVTATPTVHYDSSCLVVGITDGDSLSCLDDYNNEIKVRLNQIDAPEKGQDFGNAAKQTLSNHAYGQPVGLKISGIDKYNRVLAEVYRLSDGANVNKLMVSDGMAWAYREYMTDAHYGELEASAKAAGLGLWSHPNPVYPADYRKGQRAQPLVTQAQQKSSTYTTSTTSKKSVVQPSNGNFGKCGSKRTCKQMSSCQEARYFLNSCGVKSLDRDSDGVPCESLC